MRIVDAEWEGPLGVPYNVERETHDISSIIKKVDEWAKRKPAYKKPSQQYLYQIYGQHPVFGPNSLLYVGVTDNLSRRFEEHFNKSRFWEFNGLKVHFGFMSAEDKQALPDASDVESLLIAIHKPPLNRQCIDKPSAKHARLHVYSWGQSGVLFPECSSRWFDWEQNVGVDVAD